MSTPGLVQIWSLDILIGEAPTAVNFDVWAVNNILSLRAGANNLAFHLNSIPLSETRLRDEGIIPFYSFLRKIINTLKSSAHELGVTLPDIPNAPEDWNEEASTDSKALAAEIRPHLAEPIRPVVDWIFASRDRDPRLHWTSRMAVTSVVPDQLTRAVLAMRGTVGGSEWGSFVAQMASDELKGIAEVFNQEILRIRAQPGSGWDEEEAKKEVEFQFGNLKDLTKVGT